MVRVSTGAGVLVRETETIRKRMNGTLWAFADTERGFWRAEYVLRDNAGSSLFVSMNR